MKAVAGMLVLVEAQIGPFFGYSRAPDGFPEGEGTEKDRMKIHGGGQGAYGGMQELESVFTSLKMEQLKRSRGGTL
jgi:hypothetical protein